MAANYPADQADALTVAWWSLCHGLALLWLDGQLEMRAALMGTNASDLTIQAMDMFAMFAPANRKPVPTRRPLPGPSKPRSKQR
ncbi:hypothetical protein AB4305_33535 [Nocardia sp. 2YAB30]|uniref:hypothetical protein n=1 Tax=Nocardia sp. 2YAB30 TaxID=3233022 RepID=UPI003F9AC60A